MMKYLEQLFLLVLVLKTGAVVVEECPENQERLLIKNTFCNDSSWYHCLPDKMCQLHQFCSHPKSSQAIYVILLNNGQLFQEHIVSIPDSNTELYSHLSYYVCKSSVQTSTDKIIYDKILTLLNTSMINGENIFIRPCQYPRKNHYLPTLQCIMTRSCVPSESTPKMKYFIYNKTFEHEGNLMLYEFKMGSSNNPSYHRLAFILCRLEYTVQYHEAMPNDNKTLEKLNYASTMNPLGGNPVTNKEDYLIYGIIAVIIVSIVLLLMLFVMKYYICKHNNASKKNNTQNRRTDLHICRPEVARRSSEANVSPSSHRAFAHPTLHETPSNESDIGEVSEVKDDNEIELLMKEYKDETKKVPIYTNGENGEMNDSHVKKQSTKCVSPRDFGTNDNENESSKCLLSQHDNFCDSSDEQSNSQKLSENCSKVRS